MTFAANPAFLEALRTFRLLEPAQLDEVARMLGRFADPRALAKELIQRGWLTPYQINQLFLGRGTDLLLGSYVLLERLGEGGMGAVFKARNWKLGKIVAVKVIRKDRLSNAQAVRRFHREIRAAAQLNHPNIVLAFDADEVGGTHLFVMEYVQGIDLGRLVQAQGALPIDQACEFIRQAALGLQHAFESGLVHRDIKPSNLLVTRSSVLAAQPVGGPSGRGLSGPQSGVSIRSVVKVLDLGLARSDSGGDDSSCGTLTQEGTLMGTPDYIAPEQALNSHMADIRSDLYSLGCTFYFLLTGQVPHPGGTMTDKLLRHQLQEPTPLERLRPEVPPGVAAVIRKLLAKQPAERYQTPAELAADLNAGPASAMVHPSRQRTPLTPLPGLRPEALRTPFPPPETHPDRQPPPPRPAPAPQPAIPARPTSVPSNPFVSLTDGYTAEIGASSRHLRQVREPRPAWLRPWKKWALAGAIALFVGIGLRVLFLGFAGEPVRNPSTSPTTVPSPLTPRSTNPWE